MGCPANAEAARGEDDEERTRTTRTTRTTSRRSRCDAEAVRCAARCDAEAARCAGCALVFGEIVMSKPRAQVQTAHWQDGKYHYKKIVKYGKLPSLKGGLVNSGYRKTHGNILQGLWVEFAFARHDALFLHAKFFCFVWISLILPGMSASSFPRSFLGYFAPLYAMVIRGVLTKRHTGACWPTGLPGITMNCHIVGPEARRVYNF